MAARQRAEDAEEAAREVRVEREMAEAASYLPLPEGSPADLPWNSKPAKRNYESRSPLCL